MQTAENINQEMVVSKEAANEDILNQPHAVDAAGDPVEQELWNTQKKILPILWGLFVLGPDDFAELSDAVTNERIAANDDYYKMAA